MQGTPCGEGKAMKVSIIIVSFNTRSLLRDCLESLQRNSPICAHEICIVDNGSTDGSFELLQSNYSEQVLIHQHRGGTIAAQRNFGARVARGDYIFFLDSDCIVHQEYFVSFELKPLKF